MPAVGECDSFAISENNIIGGPSASMSTSIFSMAAMHPAFILHGHESSISSVRFSPNGRLVASASNDKNVCVWDATAGIYLRTLTGHEAGISTVIFSPDSRSVLTASDDTTLGVWDVETSTKTATLVGHEDMAFTVDVANPNEADSSSSNASSPLVASGGFDSCVKLWDLKSGKVVRSIKAHSDPVTDVHFNRDGTLLASASYDGTVRVWDLRGGQSMRTIHTEDNRPVSSAKFSPNGKFLLVGAFGGSLQLYNYAASKPLKRYRGHKHERLVITSCFGVSNGNKPYVVSGSENGKVHVWDLQTRRIAAKLAASDHGDTNRPVVAVHVHPNNGSLVTGELGDKPVVRIWKPIKQDVGSIAEDGDCEEFAGVPNSLYISAPSISSAQQRKP